MQHMCPIPITVLDEEKFEALFNYSREYAASGYPGIDEPLKQIAIEFQKHDDLVLIASSAGRPQYRGAYTYLQFAAKPSGVTTIHRLYNNMIEGLLAMRETALTTIAENSKRPASVEEVVLVKKPPEYYKQITSVSLCHSIKSFPPRLKLPGHYHAYTLRAPVEDLQQQDLLCRLIYLAAVHL